ncbi:MAG: murein transglycosylase A [Methylomonas sp.]
MSNKPLKKSLTLLIAALLLSACSNTKEKVEPWSDKRAGSEWPKLGPPLKVKNDASVQLYPTEFIFLAGWETDNHAAALASFRRSCESWRSQPDQRPLSGVFELGHIGDWKRLCAIQVRKGQEKQFFEKWFRPFAVADRGNFDGLFTGYYLPELHGSYRKSARYHVPVYGIPGDLKKRDGQTGRIEKGQFVPYYDRTEIVNGALAGKGAEILWVDNEIDAFFMEVQGSGRVIMEDGRIQGVSFADKNGRPYHAIGKTLVDNGHIPREDISMQSIRAWIVNHPEEGRRLMLQNQSVVFFRLTEAKPWEGPIGSMSAPLTAGYSLAVDRNYLPLGVPLWLDAEHPAGDRRLRRLVMAQDTGGAIKGIIRGDFYWGQGQQAGDFAGTMKSRGRYFLLVPKHLAVG